MRNTYNFFYKIKKPRGKWLCHLMSPFSKDETVLIFVHCSSGTCRHEHISPLLGEHPRIVNIFLGPATVHYREVSLYVRIVQDMYDDSTTAVRCAVGVTEGFEVKVGLHQGSALSPCLFAMVMDRMTDEIREEAPWTMMFADDIVICSESKEQVEEKLESWRYALERRGMKVNRRKTEYMCVNERQDNGSGTVKMQG